MKYFVFFLLSVFLTGEIYGLPHEKDGKKEQRKQKSEKAKKASTISIVPESEFENKNETENDTLSSPLKEEEIKDSLHQETTPIKMDTLATISDSLFLKMIYHSPTLDSLIECDPITDGPTSALPDSVIAQRLEKLNATTPFDLRFNSQVRNYINLYMDKQTDLVSRLAGLSQYYYGIFEETLDKYEIPLELKYLPVIESAMNPLARSRMGATGLWQFMYGTGKMYGLKVESYIDERCDARLSTEAAARFLSDLYKIYGDWNLVLAAYNCGPGNVNKAILRSGGIKDYWIIRPFLPYETQNYVGAFIAANYVMNYYRDHGIDPARPVFTYQQTDTVKIKRMIDFELICKKLDIPKDELQFLNPAYRLGIIPATSDKDYSVVLPADKAHRFAEIEDDIYAVAQAQQDSLKKKMEAAAKAIPQGAIRYTVKSGDTLGHIAERYRVSVSQIRQWNHISGSMIRVGQRLTIYPR